SSPDRHLRADAGRYPQADRRRLSGSRRCVEQNASGPARAYGTALSPFRSSESLRIAGVLHVACLGLEGEPERSVCELASECLVQLIRESDPLMFIGPPRRRVAPVAARNKKGK